MNIRPLSHTVLCLCFSVLTQCDNPKEKAQSSTTPAATKPETQEKIIAVPAVLAAPSNSVALVSEGLSPSFRVVASHLDIGGCSLSYSETSGAGALALFLDEILKMMPASERKDMPPGFSFANLFKMLGLDSVAAMGSSSRQRANGSYHSRNFTHMPQGRKGLMTLSGGTAEKLLLLDVAPKDTDFALEFPLALKYFAQDVMPGVIKFVPAGEREKFDKELLRPLPVLGLSTKEILDKLDARIGLFLRLDTTQKIALSPDAPPLPGMDGVIVLDRLGWLFEALKPQFMPALQGAESPATVSLDGGMITIRMKSPAGPAPMDFQPVMRFDPKADRILIASRPALFESVVAGTEKFSQSADFAQSWRDLPTDGNACVHISSRFLQTISDGITKNMPATRANSASEMAIVQKMMDWIKPLINHGQTVVLANQPDGILTSSNTSIPAGSSALTTVSTISILAGIALPAFTKIKERGHDARVINDLKQLVIALKFYAADHDGKYPDQLSELVKDGVLDDETLLEYKNPETKQGQPWLYNKTLTDSSPGTSAVLAAPIKSKDGKRVVAFNDGSVRLVTEAEFISAWGEQ